MSMCVLLSSTTMRDTASRRSTYLSCTWNASGLQRRRKKARLIAAESLHSSRPLTAYKSLLCSLGQGLDKRHAATPRLLVVCRHQTAWRKHSCSLVLLGCVGCVCRRHECEPSVMRRRQRSCVRCLQCRHGWSCRRYILFLQGDARDVHAVNLEQFHIVCLTWPILSCRSASRRQTRILWRSSCGSSLTRRHPSSSAAPTAAPTASMLWNSVHKIPTLTDAHHKCRMRWRTTWSCSHDTMVWHSGAGFGAVSCQLSTDDPWA